MSESRKQFEEELDRLKWDSDYGGYDETTKVFQAFDTVIRSLTERSRADVLEEAAKVCERLTSEYRDAYKGRIEPIDRSRLYNPHTEGLSDGAWECAEAIRALASSPSGKPGGEG